MAGLLFGAKEAESAGEEPKGEEGKAAEKPNGEAASEAKPNGEEPEKRSLFAKPGGKAPVDSRDYRNNPRFQELRGQRDEAREGRVAAERERDVARPFQQAVESRYGTEGGLDALRFDIALLDAFEALEKSGDAEARRVAMKVRQSAEGGRVEPKQASAARKAEPAAESAESPLLVRAFEQTARASVLETLKGHGIKDAFQRTIANDLLREVSKQGAKALADLTPEAIEEHAQRWIAEHGFSEEELTGRKVKKAEPRTTPSSQGAASGGSESSETEPNGRPKSEPKVNNFRDWEERHRARTASLVRSLGARS